MNINKSLIESFSKTTLRGAYGASLYKGKNDKIAADQAAVDEMRNELNKIGASGARNHFAPAQQILDANSIGDIPGAICPIGLNPIGYI